MFYRIKMSENQVYALCDIVMGYEGEDSSRYDVRTFASLKRRGLVSGSIDRPKLHPEARKFAFSALEIHFSEREKNKIIHRNRKVA